MRNRKRFLAALLASAPLLFGCAGTDLVVLAQAPWSLAGPWRLASETGAHVVVAPLDVSEIGDPAMAGMTESLDGALQETLHERLGIRPMAAGGPSPSDRLVLRPRVTSFQPKSRDEVLRVRVQITTPAREIVDEIALRDLPGSCLTCPKPGEPGAPSADARARHEIKAIASALADYVSLRLHGGNHRYPGMDVLAPRPPSREGSAPGR